MLISAECRQGLLLLTLTEEGEREDFIEVRFTATNTDAYLQLFLTHCVQLSTKLFLQIQFKMQFCILYNSAVVPM